MRVKEGQFHHHTTQGMGRYCVLVLVLICVVLLIGYALYYMHSNRVPIAHHSVLRTPGTDVISDGPEKQEPQTQISRLHYAPIGMTHRSY